MPAKKSKAPPPRVRSASRTSDLSPDRNRAGPSNRRGRSVPNPSRRSQPAKMQMPKTKFTPIFRRIEVECAILYKEISDLEKRHAQMQPEDIFLAVHEAFEKFRYEDYRHRYWAELHKNVEEMFQKMKICCGRSYMSVKPGYDQTDIFANPNNRRSKVYPADMVKWEALEKCGKCSALTHKICRRLSIYRNEQVCNCRREGDDLRGARMERIPETPLSKKLQEAVDEENRRLEVNVLVRETFSKNQKFLNSSHGRTMSTLFKDRTPPQFELPPFGWVSPRSTVWIFRALAYFWDDSRPEINDQRS